MVFVSIDPLSDVYAGQRLRDGRATLFAGVPGFENRRSGAGRGTSRMHGVSAKLGRKDNFPPSFSAHGG